MTSLSNLNSKDVVASTATNSQNHSLSKRLFLADKTTKSFFLIDTGSDVSVISNKLAKPNNTQTPYLYAANGTQIKTFGYITCSIDLGLIESSILNFS